MRNPSRVLCLFIKVLKKKEGRGEMNGFIDKDGDLQIIRAGDPKPQQCFYDRKQICGDHCPHFSEPQFINLSNFEADIEICFGKTIHFDCFWDKRKDK